MSLSFVVVVCPAHCFSVPAICRPVVFSPIMFSRVPKIYLFIENWLKYLGERVDPMCVCENCSSIPGSPVIQFFQILSTNCQERGQEDWTNDSS